MKVIGLLDTTVRTANQGDYIIVESVKRELSSVLEDAFVVGLPTHSPIVRKGEFGLRPRGNSDYQLLNRIDFSLLCGTNLLAEKITSKWNQWNIQEYDTKFLKNVVCVGVGSGPGFSTFSSRANKLYSSVFAQDFIHSARDQRTQELLKSVGLKALNTGCATMWSLTDAHCSNIPTEKSDEVVFTLTDYKMNQLHDSELIRLLLSEYQRVWFWIQGIGDLDYLTNLGFADRVNFIGPHLDLYNNFLDTHTCDYVGTRLHAGIKAMQKFKRAIILKVDNRSDDISQTYGINVVARDDIDELRKMINGKFVTRVGIHEDSIDTFIQQFGD